MDQNSTSQADIADLQQALLYFWVYNSQSRPANLSGSIGTRMEISIEITTNNQIKVLTARVFPVLWTMIERPEKDQTKVSPSGRWRLYHHMGLYRLYLFFEYGSFGLIEK